MQTSFTSVVIVILNWIFPLAAPHASHTSIRKPLGNFPLKSLFVPSNILLNFIDRVPKMLFMLAVDVRSIIYEQHAVYLLLPLFLHQFLTKLLLLVSVCLSANWLLLFYNLQTMSSSLPEWCVVKTKSNITKPMNIGERLYFNEKMENLQHELYWY